jgi:hypothetical protein
MGRIYRFYTNERLNDVQIDFLKNDLISDPKNKKIIIETRNFFYNDSDGKTTFDVVIESDPDNTSNSEENWYEKIIKDIDKGINERRLVAEIIYTEESAASISNNNKNKGRENNTNKIKYITKKRK